MFQFGAVQVPKEGVALTNVYPVGKISFTITFVSLLIPRLVASIVKVTLLPTNGEALFTVFTTFKSEQPLNILAETLAVAKPQPYVFNTRTLP